MSGNISAMEVACDFNGIHEEEKVAGDVTVVEGGPAAGIVPIEAVKSDRDAGGDSDLFNIAEAVIDEYADMFAELAKN